MSWQERAKRVVGALCYVSWAQANRLPNGRMRKQHQPYSVPEAAMELVDCLNTDDEQRAKAIMLYDYDVEQVEKCVC